MTEFFAYAVPHLLGALIVTDYLFGRYRWALVSELYELMQALYSLPAIVEVIRSPRSPEFAVTPKGEFLEENFITSLAGPFYWMLLFNIASLIAGCLRLYLLPKDTDVILITMFWETFNLALLVCAIGALYELKQRRETPRVSSDIPALLTVAGKTIPGVVSDMSSGGLGLRVRPQFIDSLGVDIKGLDIEVQAYNSALKHDVTLPGTVTSAVLLSSGVVQVGMQVNLEELEHKKALVSLVYGDSERWVAERASRMPDLPVMDTLRILFGSGIKSSAAHLRHWWRDTWKAAGRRLAGQQE